ncbi:hypothetical protein FA15DRAFT_690896 [Coprinopsis marcescibilis]|uniref:Uncharacterized protein n=1 Tax=Coprinopsis marcescibilis TaxID=230819 RepID=A0A5C3LBY0_COPMA|nr:hypothetical protein FA15DRAFT_690896 [Coprinopsis marcescibilis]
MPRFMDPAFGQCGAKLHQDGKSQPSFFVATRTSLSTRGLREQVPRMIARGIVDLGPSSTLWSYLYVWNVASLASYVRGRGQFPVAISFIKILSGDRHRDRCLFLPHTTIRYVKSEQEPWLARISNGGADKVHKSNEPKFFSVEPYCLWRFPLAMGTMSERRDWELTLPFGRNARPRYVQDGRYIAWGLINYTNARSDLIITCLGPGYKRIPSVASERGTCTTCCKGAPHRIRLQSSLGSTPSIRSQTFQAGSKAKLTFTRCKYLEQIRLIISTQHAATQEPSKALMTFLEVNFMIKSALLTFCIRGNVLLWIAQYFNTKPIMTTIFGFHKNVAYIMCKT